MVRGRGGYSGGGGYSSSGRGSSASGRGGSYRGSSSSYYNNSRSGGGGSSRSTGGFGNSSSSSYNNSHSRGSYSSNTYNNYDSKSRDRLSSSRHSERHDDHKRTYRGSRDRSPERKRSRHEDIRINSNYSSSYRRNDTTRNSRPPPPTLSSSATRVTSYRSQHRDDSSSHRNSNHQNDSMGPPKSLPPRSRIIRSSRGIVNSRLRGSASTRPPRNVRIIRPRRDIADMQIMRKKLLLAHQRDRARRIKIARLTSSLRKRRDDDSSNRRKLSTSSSTTRKSRSEKKDDNEGRSSRTEDNEDKKKLFSTKSKSDIMDDEDDEHLKSVTNKKGEESEKDEPKLDDKDEKSETELSEDNDVQKSINKKEKEEKERKIDNIRETKSKSPRKLKRSFIKLTCVHCRTKCLTFQEYSNHLYYRVHKAAMRRLALRQKAQLSQMRLKQRNAQRDIEQNSKDDLEDYKPQFCLLCRLNYRQAKAKHQLSEHHRNMKKFLMPYCSTCHIAFKSPMMYEAHRCSLDHIKRKARNNESHSENSSDEKEVDLANFMTVDSVGEIDGGAHNDDEIDEENVEDCEKDKVNVGVDHVKKTEAYYCDLCRMYFQCKDDDEIILKKHCSTRSHLKAFIRYKEDQDLQAEAERVQRKESSSSSSKDKKKIDESPDEKNNDEKDKQVDGDDNEDTGEDKLWEDVDKDLGDLLREVGPEDDEEDGSVLNIDIESEKAKAKEMNGGTTKPENSDDKENEPKEDIIVVKIKKEKVDSNNKSDESIST